MSDIGDGIGAAIRLAFVCAVIVAAILIVLAFGGGYWLAHH
jgi:hypothetical protein